MAAGPVWEPAPAIRLCRDEIKGGNNFALKISIAR